MARLLGLYVGLIAVFSGAILAIRLIGGTQPNPIAVLFTNPDGSACQMPCLFGVHPGTTTLDEALRLLDKHPLTHGMNTKVDGLGGILYSQEAAIDLSAVDGSLINQINDTLVHTPILVRAIQQANPGNQLLFFGKLGNGLARGSGPPYLITYCSYDRQLCFDNFSLAVNVQWQDEIFDNLTIYDRPDNIMP